MATLTTNLIRSDKRTRSDGKMPIAIHISNNGQDVIRTGVFVSDSEWDAKEKKVVGSNAKLYNRTIDITKGNIQTVINNLTAQGKLNTVTATEIKQIVKAGSDGTVQSESSNLNITPVVFTKPSEPEQNKATEKNARFFEFVDEFLGLINVEKTYEIFEDTIKKLRKFYNNKNPGDSAGEIDSASENPVDTADESKLTFNDVNVGFVRRFEAYMEKDGLSINSRGLHLRNLRRFYNVAIAEGKASLEMYPFGHKFKIKKQKTIHRNMELESLITLRDYPCEPHQQEYVDMFFLGFYLIGINMVDLSRLKEITNSGRIGYSRSKGKRLYSVKVEPEALAIINKYRGEKFLLNIMEGRKKYKNYLRTVNDNLKEVGTLEKVEKHGKKIRKEKEDAPFAHVSWYYARHTWGTIAGELDIPDETIEQALGHGKQTTTDIYINRNQKKVDDANRKVIDYVNSFKLVGDNIEEIEKDEDFDTSTPNFAENLEKIIENINLDNPTPKDMKTLKVLSFLADDIKKKIKFGKKQKKHIIKS
jgi:site-specific recombinase XerD